MSFGTLFSGAFILLFGTLPGLAQRTYVPSSVLASGNWYKLGVKEAGIYRIDMAFLQSLGVSTQGLNSSSIRLFGNGGGMLGEAANAERIDDLQEIAIQVADGGDGIFNGNDQILFYAPGPNQWTRDSLNQRFDHRQHLYSEHSYYFLSVGGTGKRIPIIPSSGLAGQVVNSYSGRYYHELDTFNFLSSGKEWYGEEFAASPGKTLLRNFSIPLSTVPGTPIFLRTNLISRSVGSPSVFNVKINNQVMGQVSLPTIPGGIYDPVASELTDLLSGTAGPGNQSIEFNYAPGSFNAQGWLNWFEVFYRGKLSLKEKDQLMFRDWMSLNSGNVEFQVSDASSNARVWEITNLTDVIERTGSFTNDQYRFTASTERLREFIVFNPSNYLKPINAGRVNSQDLHQSAPADMIIITPPVFKSQATRIATLHLQHHSLRSAVITTEEVYNEFSSGAKDPVAIRDLVKMYFDRYGNDPASKPRYLLLLGDASFDPRGKLFPGREHVPSYQHAISLDPLNSYVSDDFFGFLEDHEDINSGVVVNLLDIGIGRVPALSVYEARDFVDKLETYLSAASLGPWRTQLSFVADDEDNNLHLQDAEQVTASAAAVNPLFNINKIYLDAYFQESGAGGERYPQANLASNNQLFNGTLIWNYNGHGGPARLAQETILDQEAVNKLDNGNRLSLFITGTCDFAPFDNPRILSIGENLLLRPKSGAIALMTTTRVVFAFSNRVMNDNYIRFALDRDVNGRYLSLGDAMKEAKNFTYQNFSDITNNRKFTLLGDPALTLNFPRQGVRVTSVNGQPVTLADTLKATTEVKVEGEVVDESGNLLAGFNGRAYPSVFDKARSVQTLGNDPGSPVTSFNIQQNLLFRGRATVIDGRFSFSFRVPRDINLVFGNGKMNIYAENGNTDASGIFENFIVGGTGSLPVDDDQGPEIRAWLNDEMFVNGGLVNETPLLIVKLSDTSGINTTGLGIGHDIVATIDGDNRQYFILNDLYESEMDDHRKGVVRFQLPNLEPGIHSLSIKAWDAMNNSAERTLEFLVAKDEMLEISHVLNYPNPFTTATQFWFEHNRPGQELKVQLQVMTITGRQVKSFSQKVLTAGNRFAGMDWDGRDEYGQRLGRGVYLYRLRVTDHKGLKKEVLEKLVIF